MSDNGKYRPFDKERSKTFEGIAEAMAEQWGGLETWENFK